jgi:hypothetical protein
MTEIKTNAIVGKGDRNGLVDLAEQFAREVRGDAPRKVRACLALVVPRRITIDAGNGAETVAVEIVRIEVLLDEDFKGAEQFIRRSLEARMGQTTLPLDLEHDLEAAFQGIDFDAPEDGDGPGDGDGPPDDDEPGPDDPGDGDRSQDRTS